ncbi:AMP-binding protein [Pollutimonas sp. M17]|uniref:AMP-binding protein n=1 Tax=Pollutimonas sp. M17 TaxID=2962065 RepID=UPI0021F3D762|nr:class I adenylate-forming enzyme family protein [Pollutimonas sp. M17]UYO94604.1 acyl--CoA ligase [Pollutimonas sp. M17]HWK69680.1 class I adenylate-forming enzyme family protein [Burkholderiaceae bacterium]
MLTIDFLHNMIEQHGDEVAIEDGESQVTYAELAITVKALAVALQMNDPTPGSRVALCAAQSLEYLVSVMAILQAGKILVPLSCESTTEQLHQLLIDTHPTAVLVDDKGDPLIHCDDELKIRFSQFEGLVRTYRGKEFIAYEPGLLDQALAKAKSE